MDQVKGILRRDTHVTLKDKRKEHLGRDANFSKALIVRQHGILGQLEPFLFFLF